MKAMEDMVMKLFRSAANLDAIWRDLNDQLKDGSEYSYNLAVVNGFKKYREDYLKSLEMEMNEEEAEMWHNVYENLI